MKRLLLAVMLAVPLVALAEPQGQNLVFRGGTDLVTVDVNVNSGKKPVTGLRPEDFEVYDSGVRQVVTDVTYGRLPIDLRLVFDTSGSIDDVELQTYVRAMKQIAQSLQPQDRCDIVTFSRRIVEAAALQPPPVKIDARRVAGNTTSFLRRRDPGADHAARPGPPAADDRHERRRGQLELFRPGGDDGDRQADGCCRLRGVADRDVARDGRQGRQGSCANGSRR